MFYLTIRIIGSCLFIVFSLFSNLNRKFLGNAYPVNSGEALLICSLWIGGAYPRKLGAFNFNQVGLSSGCGLQCAVL